MIDLCRIKIAIASGKGGTGKTFISTNLFHTLVQLGYKVTLVDCDAEEPNDMLFFKTGCVTECDVKQKVPVIDLEKCVYCGKCKEYCNYNAIFFLGEQKVIRVLDDLCHGCGACTYACDSGAILEKDVSLGKVSTCIINDNSKIVEARLRVGVYTPVPVIKAALETIYKDKIVIMDSPPGTSCPFIQTVSTADYVVLVTEPTPFGLSDLKQSVETLKTMNKSYGVIVNRAGIGDDGVYEYLKQENIPLLMEVPFDKEIALSYSKGEFAVNNKDEWNSLLELMFITICEKYGNVNN